MTICSEDLINEYIKDLVGDKAELQKEINKLYKRMDKINFKIANTKGIEDNCSLFISVLSEDFINDMLLSLGENSRLVACETGLTVQVGRGFVHEVFTYFFDNKYTKEQKIDVLNSLKYIYELKNEKKIKSISSLDFKDGELAICCYAEKNKVYSICNVVIGESWQFKPKHIKQEGNRYSNHKYFIKVSDILEIMGLNK